MSRSLLLIMLCGLASASQIRFANAEEPLVPRADLSLNGLLGLFPDSTESSERDNTFEVQHTVRLTEIPAQSQQVRMWVALPSDSEHQKLLSLEVRQAPGSWQLVQDAERRGWFLAINVAHPETESLEVAVAYRVRREPAFVDLQTGQAASMTPTLQALLAEHLVRNAPHMEVTPEFQKIADDVCGAESNIASQALLLLRHAASTVDHYSYSTDPKMPTCGIGSASVCKQQGGGCCTDLNSYFITLARARGIPARLQMGYRLQEANMGVWVDPGYRCWVEYFVPNYGWIAADVVEADRPGGLGPTRWFTGLTSRRIWLNQGREFNFGEDLAVGRVNHMNIAYAEIDGKPVRLLPDGDLKPQISRQMHYIEVE